jgi:nitric oxide reductase subunit B
MNINSRIAIQLIRFSLMLILAAIVFGVLSAFVFIDQGNLGKFLPFRNLRPLHVSSAVYWILTAAAGSVLFFIDEATGKKNPYYKVSKWYLWVWIFTVLSILTSFFFSKFGGREYWEFPKWLALPILVSWILFAIKIVHSVLEVKGKWPVYLWMWVTGVIFFIITFTEENLWVLPWVRNNIIRDITLQWKSNGSLVGSWNMMVYGTGIYIMCKISGDKSTAYNRQSYFFYFLGLTNLLFNWGHHTYVLPAAPWIRQVSYIISMTEWIIFLNIIRNWRKSISLAIRHKNLLSYKFLFASEVWVFLNLALALLMSIPAVNIYTHGTHITVAHAMGTTIGINTMILMASIFYIFSTFKEWTKKESFIIHSGFWILNVPLLFFWLSLIIAGVIKGYYSATVPGQNFALMMTKILPYMQIFTWSGVFVMFGLGILAVMGLKARLIEPSVALPEKIDIPQDAEITESIVAD